MSYKLKTIPPFDNELKQLSKKYPSLKNDYSRLLDLLEVNPTTGTPIGKDCYKIRMAIKSKQKGKSGGARVITCVRLIKETVYLLSIYDKSSLDNISDEELMNRLKEIKL
jgi:mRNA-degrading endonuclease RelE of RelBE toxin-antitoxin system